MQSAEYPQQHRKPSMTGRFRQMLTFREETPLVKPVGNFVSSVKMADRTYAIARSGAWHRMYLVEGKNRAERRRLDYKYRKLEVKQLKAKYA